MSSGEVLGAASGKTSKINDFRVPPNPVLGGENLGYAIFGAEKAPAGMCAVKMDFYLQKAPILGAEKPRIRSFGCGKSPCGHGRRNPLFLKHREPLQGTFIELR